MPPKKREPLTSDETGSPVERSENRLIIRCNVKVTKVLQIEPSRTNRDNVTNPPIEIAFDERFLWDSEINRIPMGVLEFYGGLGPVLEKITAKINALNAEMPSSPPYTYMTNEEKVFYVKSEAFKDVAEKSLAYAMEHPDDPEYREIFEQLQALHTKRTSTVKVGIATIG